MSFFNFGSKKKSGSDLEILRQKMNELAIDSILRIAEKREDIEELRPIWAEMDEEWQASFLQRASSVDISAVKDDCLNLKFVSGLEYTQGDTAWHEAFVNNVQMLISKGFRRNYSIFTAERLYLEVVKICMGLGCMANVLSFQDKRDGQKIFLCYDENGIVVELEQEHEERQRRGTGEFLESAIETRLFESIASLDAKRLDIVKLGMQNLLIESNMEYDNGNTVWHEMRLDKIKTVDGPDFLENYDPLLSIWMLTETMKKSRRLGKMGELQAFRDKRTWRLIFIKYIQETLIVYTMDDLVNLHTGKL